jgi:hypothetical protein
MAEGAVQAMKTTSDETDVVHMPPDLLAEARRAANEEHRPADELVSDAVRRYLQERKQFAPHNTAGPMKRKRLSELFAPLRGLDIDLSRNPSTGRPVDLPILM